MRGRTIPELSRERLADVWQILTAEGVVAAAHPRERASDVTAVAAETWTISAIKRRFRSAYAVFDYFGWVGEVRAAGQHDLRLVGHGGLLVGRPDGSHAWRWYCFAAGVGGDVVDAVRWCEGEPHRAAQR